MAHVKLEKPIYCPHCGKLLRKLCPKCGQPLVVYDSHVIKGKHGAKPVRVRYYKCATCGLPKYNKPGMVAKDGIETTNPGIYRRSTVPHAVPVTSQ